MKAKDDPTRRALILAGRLILDVKRTSVAAVRPTDTADAIVLRALADSRIAVDSEAGTIRNTEGRIADRIHGNGGYRRLPIGSNRHAQSHRVIWLAAFGPIPPGAWHINHRNRCRTDNRIRNLELVLPIGNQDHARGRTDYLRVGLDDEGAVDPYRLAEIMAGSKSQTASKRSRVLPGPRVHGVAMLASPKPRRLPPRV